MSCRLPEIFVCLTLLLLTAASAATRFVNVNSALSLPPYTNWITAASNIQSAVDVADPGDQVLVTNGIYRTGGRPVSGILLSRVTIDKPIVVSSVNGPAVTVIEGFGLRCAYLTNFATLSGFTLTNGATYFWGDGSVQLRSGGAVFCAAQTAIVSNCIIVSNSSAQYGGGVFGGTLYRCYLGSNYTYSLGGGAYLSVLQDCTLIGNSAAESGGAHASTLTNCLILGNNADRVGGGAINCTLENCIISSNTATSRGGGGVVFSTLYRCTLSSNSSPGQLTQGGGAWATKLYHCLLIGNSAYSGGGAEASTLINCTVVSNFAEYGGGILSSSATNSIVLYNAAARTNANYDSYNCKLSHSCTTPLADGPANFTNNPMFVDALASNFRLPTNSPCVNGGENVSSLGVSDLDGRPRTVGGAVDIGAYETQAAGTNAYIHWLQQFRLPTHVSVDAADVDLDGATSWQEWQAGTNPTNSLSVLRLFAPISTTNGFGLRWASVPGRNYFVERRGPGFPPVIIAVTNNSGTENLGVHWDTNPGETGPFIYRVGIQE